MCGGGMVKCKDGGKCEVGGVCEWMGLDVCVRGGYWCMGVEGLGEVED